ncbi:MAG: hypothetical protein R6W91_07765, partial [Thermoplasmata archaeon]
AGRITLKKATEPFLLAHHPSCKYFEHHTIVVRGRRLCMGCFVMYPVAAMSLAVLWILNIIAPLDSLFLLMMAVVLFGINGVRKLLFKDNFRKAIHIIFRAELGVTLALAIMSIALARGNERLFIAIFVLAVAIVYNAYNGKRNLAVCKTCPQHHLFPRCEGLIENYKQN